MSTLMFMDHIFCDYSTQSVLQMSVLSLVIRVVRLRNALWIKTVEQVATVLSTRAALPGMNQYVETMERRTQTDA